MRKFLFAVMAVAAISFTSCGNKTQNVPADEVDTVINVDSLATDAAETSISALSEQIEAKDATKLQEAITAIQAKVAELIKTNPEVAKEYVAKVQEFLKENADKVKEIIGDNAAAAAALAAVTETDAESMINGLMEKIDNAATDATDAAADAVNETVEEGKAAVKDAANEVKDAANNAANEAKDAAKAKANEAIDKAADNTKKALGL